MIGLAPINTETGLYGVNFFLSLKGKTQANGIHMKNFILNIYNGGHK